MSERAVLWQAEEAAAATGGALLQGAGWQAGGVSIDSRSLAPGDLFVALHGPNFDAHDLLEAAAAAGAAAAMVHRLPDNAPAGLPLLQVADTMLGLEALGRAARARSSARLVAVTGSVGKTSTKEMLAAVLAAQGKTHATAGNLNNHWGVPLSLARMPADAAFAVFELGMSAAGEISALSRQVAPDVALITTVAPAHLEFFASVAAIADAKAEIFDGLRPGGVAILPADNEHIARLEAAAGSRGVAAIRRFGSADAADWRLLSYAAEEAGGRIEAATPAGSLGYRLPLPGRHQALNSLAVLAAVDALGAEPTLAATALAGIGALKGRGARQELDLPQGRIRLIDESYNASPAAMEAALAVLAGQPGRRIAVLGDMRELGAAAGDLHAALANAATAGADRVFTCGPAMRHLHLALPQDRRGEHAEDSAALAPLVLAAVQDGDTVMVKGSLGSRMAAVVQALMAAATTGGEAQRHA